ncbi:MAG: SusF/SusE family outer membrane protein [Muribaculaceae bacterium]|nr:SusF/SusE family outer membrane protein [Muribaculaceae bacterium]
MRKTALYGLTAIFAFSFAACDNYEEPNPAPQTNPQESILKTDEVEVTSCVTDAPYVLEALDESNQDIVLASIDAPTLPEGYRLVPVVEISSNGFGRVAEVPATIVENEGKYDVCMTPDDLQGVYYANISKGPKAKEIEARFILKSVVGDGKNQMEAYVGGKDNYYGPYKFTVQPFPSTLVIEQNYYILGSINGWSVEQAVKFNHSSADPYDDPVFTLKLDIPDSEAAEGWWWKIIPESTYVTGNWVDAANGSFGVAENGDEALEGLLVARTDTEDCGAGCLKTGGQLLLTINIEEGTYAFTSAVDFLYTPGDANGWNQTNSQLLYTSNYADYFGYAVLSPNGFKFCNAPDWNHINYGLAAEEGKLSTAGDAGNLTVATAGLYWCEVNTASLTYSTNLISTIGVIGDATPGGWDASTALTPDENNLVWKGTVTFGGGEFKFRANDGWDINLGGSLSDLSQDGSNIPSPGAGTYEVTLNLASLPYSCTLVKQ